MRPRDVDEIMAVHGTSVRQILHEAVYTSTETLSAFAPDGGLLCVFGLAARSAISDTAAPWLLGTPRLEDFNRVLARDGRAYVGRALTLYRRLENRVDARNRWSLVWLRRLGFEIEPAQPYGVEKRMFHLFHTTRKGVHHV